MLLLSNIYLALCIIAFLQLAFGLEENQHALKNEEDVHIPLDQIPIALVKEREEFRDSVVDAEQLPFANSLPHQRFRSKGQAPPPFPFKSHPPVGPPTPFSVPPLFPTQD